MEDRLSFGNSYINLLMVKTSIEDVFKTKACKKITKIIQESLELVE
jgi:hypothetical protein